MKKRDEKLELMDVLPRREEVFFCEDPGRMDIWDKPMDNVRIEVRNSGFHVWYYCYGDIDGVSTPFGAELTLEGACQVIKSLIPAECAAGKRAEHPMLGDDLLLDDLEHQRLKEETRQAYLNGGRTGYLYDDDGNEYYTTRDGIRHYTRVEG